ncbi:hypothetical protein FNV43_RR01685 [Rhamnella rubrinervis]|uniref:Uncharacterized protein n=1 Tax=Rhamnella rubrinervis TaxID=2594499 RepID=A0A8K0MT76_9ROSA|nr:hypothetical protein FNV43_RR01685 [Rhamnella rubrinervis]
MKGPCSFHLLASINSSLGKKVMIIVWNFLDQVAYADLVAAGSLAAAREKGLVSMAA